MIATEARAIANALVPAVALGLARFSYGTLVPAMHSSLGWSYAELALPAAANGAGYLIGALAGSACVRRFGVQACVVGGLVATTASIATTGAFDTLAWVATLRLSAGVFGGIAFVGGAVVAVALREGGARRAIAWYPAGAGVGVIISATLVPPLAEGGSWQRGWLGLGIVALLATTTVWAAAERPSRATPRPRPPAPRRTHGSAPGRKAQVPRAAMLAYGLFGAGCIIYATFVLAYMRDAGVDEDARRWFWFGLGGVALISVAIWPVIQERAAGGGPMGIPIALAATGALTIVVSTSPVGVALSALLFGSSWLAVVSGITTIVRRDLPPDQWARGVSLLTVAFGVGQLLGPLLTALSGGSTANLRWWLAVAALLLIAAAVASTRIRTTKGALATGQD